MPTTSLTIKGDTRLRRKLLLLPKQYRKELKILLNNTGKKIVKTARESIRTSSGNHLPSLINGRIHWSSPPGTPPNKLTGDLARGIILEQKATQKEITISIVSTDFKSLWLELGTRDGRIAKRPFMGPAFRKHSPKFTKSAKKVMKRANRKIAKLK